MLLIDGSNLLHRQLHSKNFHLENSAGDRNGLAHGFFISLHSIVRKYQLRRGIVVCWDRREHGSSRYRQEIWSGYKQGTKATLLRESVGNNKEKDFLKIYLFNRNLLHTELLPLAGCLSIMCEDVEADDIISFITKNIPGKKTIISSDEDFLQLISGDVDWMRYSPKPEKNFNMQKFIEEFKLEREFYAEQFIIAKAIAGDVNEHPGVKGIGMVNAIKIAKILVNSSFECLDESDRYQKKLIDFGKENLNRNIKLINLSKIDSWTTDYIKKQLTIACKLTGDEEFLVKRLERLELNKVSEIVYNIIEANNNSGIKNVILRQIESA